MSDDYNPKRVEPYICLRCHRRVEYEYEDCPAGKETPGKGTGPHLRCTCAEIQAADPSRHFRGCPARVEKAESKVFNVGEMDVIHVAMIDKNTIIPLRCHYAGEDSPFIVQIPLQEWENAKRGERGLKSELRLDRSCPTEAEIRGHARPLIHRSNPHAIGVLCGASIPCSSVPAERSHLKDVTCDRCLEISMAFQPQKRHAREDDCLCGSGTAFCPVHNPPL
jgi:hypothetical protein